MASGTAVPRSVSGVGHDASPRESEDKPPPRRPSPAKMPGRFEDAATPSYSGTAPSGLSQEHRAPRALLRSKTKLRVGVVRSQKFLDPPTGLVIRSHREQKLNSGNCRLTLVVSSSKPYERNDFHRSIARKGRLREGRNSRIPGSAPPAKAVMRRKYLLTYPFTMNELSASPGPGNRAIAGPRWSSVHPIVYFYI
jgi:hypothetical protein